MGQPQPHHHSIQQRRRGGKGPSARDLDELRALWRHLPVKALAHRLGVSRMTVYRWAKKAGCIAPLATSDEFVTFRYECVTHCGYTFSTLAAALGVSVQRVAGWVRRGWLERKKPAESAKEPVGDRVDFSDTGVWQLWVQHPHEVFPHGMTAEQSIWLAGMQRTAHEGRVRESA